MNDPEFIKDNPWIETLRNRGKDDKFTGVNKNCNNSNNSNTEFKIKNKIKLKNNKINNENISQKSITITTIITKNDNRCKLTYFNLALEFLRKNYEFTQKAFFLYLMEIGCSYFTFQFLLGFFNPWIETLKNRGKDNFQFLLGFFQKISEQHYRGKYTAFNSF